MELIIGIIIFVITHIWILHTLDNWNPYEYDTPFCRDIRASSGMIVYASDIEETRKRLAKKNSKF